ncbi:MAG: choice-of-anchor Q domain-containing protein, partial [Planctomycetota bacterium]
MRQVIFLPVIIVAILLPGSPVYSAEYFVDGVIGDDGRSGSSWGQAFLTIQRGITAAATGDVVWVGDAVYSGTNNKDLSFGGKDITLVSENGADTCIIDCQGSGRGFNFENSESSLSVLKGFTIRNGNASDGGGIRCYNATPQIINCRIINNAASANGGGIYFGTNTKAVNCIIANNSAVAGGGVYSMCGVFNGPIIVNCVITYNNATVGGGIYSSGINGFTYIYSSILWFNTAPTASQAYAATGNIVHFRYGSYSDVPGYKVGSFSPSYSTVSNPMLVDPANLDFHLQGSSPCIDTGSNDYVPDEIETDYEGKVRIHNGTVDMGIYETPPTGPPGAFNLQEPADGFVLRNPQTVMNWQKSPDATEYDLYFSTSPSPAFHSSTYGNSFFADSLQDGGQYYWKVVARNSFGDYSSAVRSFSVSVPIKFAWAFSTGGSGGSSEYGQGIAVFPDDSFVAIGKFVGSVTFGAGEPNETVLTNSMGWDVFIAKWHDNCTLAWAKKAEGPSNNSGGAVAAFPDGSCVAVGGFSENATFGEGEPEQTTLISSGSGDVYIARYNSDGTLAWAKRAGGSGIDLVRAVVALSDGSCVITGYFDNTATFGPGDPDQTILSPAGWYDMYVARYNADGTLAWAKNAGGTHIEEGKGITALSDNKVVVCGNFHETATFGPGEPGQTNLVSVADRDMFIAKYNTDGTLAWVVRAGGASQDYCEDIVSLSDDSFAIAGSFYQNCVFSPGEPEEIIIESAGSTDIFLAKYDATGSIVWVKNVGNSGSDSADGIDAFSDDSLAVCGWFETTVVFGEGESNSTTLYCAGLNDIFSARYSTTGSLLWAKRAGCIHSDEAYEIGALSSGGVVFTGGITNNSVFGNGEIGEMSLISNGAFDIFAAREGAEAPGPPTVLRTGGKLNPTSLGCSNMILSAVYKSGLPQLNATERWVQIDNDSDFSSPHADSGWLSDCTVAPNQIWYSPNYAGPPFTSQVTYYWRVRFKHSGGLEGEWSSETAYFRLAQYSVDFQNTGWHLLQIPCYTGMQTVQELLGDDLGILWIWRYSEAARKWIQVGANETFQNGVGYFVWCKYPGEVAGFNGTPVSGGTDPILLSWTNTGSFGNDGWNLVRHPYPSALSWFGDTSLQNC